MDVDEKLREFKQYFIIAGLGIGALGVLDWLPVEFLVFGQYTRFVYLAVVALAVYSYLKFHWGNQYGPKPAGYSRTVPVRDLSNRKYTRGLESKVPQKNRSTLPPMQSGSGYDQFPSKDIFDKFNKT